MPVMPDCDARPAREVLLGRVQDAPPSAKLVFKTLQYEDALTQNQLAEHTRLPQRTVRHALRILDDHDVLTTRVRIRDARQKTYSLVPPLQSPDTASER